MEINYSFLKNAKKLDRDNPAYRRYLEILNQETLPLIEASQRRKTLANKLAYELLIT